VALSTLGPEAKRQVEIGRDIMREYRGVFKALAE
jgi:hypothetical protein